MTRDSAAAKSFFLVGFMGVGKSTVGRHLASELGMPFYDMDEEIERTTGKMINEIFETDGEDFFRALETELLRSIVKRKPGVVATGGGTFCRPENRALMRSGGVSVWLDAPDDTILERGSRQQHRPLWTNAKDMQALLQERLPVYRQADVHFRLESSTAEDAGSRLAILLKAYSEDS